MRHSWLPNKLEDVLRMAKIWLDALATEKALAWGVPPAERTAMLILKLIYAEGTEALADMHTDMEYQVRHGKYNPAHPVANAAAGEIIAVPVSPLELPMVFTTGRRHENITYGNEDSGKTAYFDIRISNGTGGETEGYGPWCPIFSAVIP